MIMDGYVHEARPDARDRHAVNEILGHEAIDIIHEKPFHDDGRKHRPDAFLHGWPRTLPATTWCSTLLCTFIKGFPMNEMVLL